MKAPIGEREAGWVGRRGIRDQLVQQMQKLLA